MKVAIYTRVSTNMQAEKDISIPMQKKKCKEFIRERKAAGKLRVFTLMVDILVRI